MTAEAVLADELADDAEVEDLADVAALYPVVKKRLDFSKLNAAEVLSLGDVDDMARELGTDPSRLAGVLAREPEKMGLEVAIVLAWIIGRKRDADLELGYVRRFWQVEMVGLGKPNPTPARTRTQRSSGRRG